jgi:hypothetical protein
MNNASVIFKDNEQSKKVFQLFYKVLNGEEALENLNMESLKQNYGFELEDIAVFFELMAKYLSTSKTKEVEENNQVIK